MMRMLKPVNITDPAHVTRICAGWLKEGLGLKIVEYRIGNSFTGSIDILAAGTDSIYLVTINTGRLSDAVLGSLTGYRWYMENREFLARVYPRGEVDLGLPGALMILSPSFPPEMGSILKQVLKVEVRLFQYLIFGSENDPEIFVEEVCPAAALQEPRTHGFRGLVKELGIEKAGMSDDEIGRFLDAMRA